MRRNLQLKCLMFCVLLALAPRAMADETAVIARRLLAAYPDHLIRQDGGDLVWKDGMRLAIGAPAPDKPLAQWLAAPSLRDMFRYPYVAGRAGLSPAAGVDPGRARTAELFDKMYGDCSRNEVARHLVDVVWLPAKVNQRLKMTSINGVADKLAAVSRALDKLPVAFDPFLYPAAGTYNCRPIAGTNRASAHGHGIAIDIAIGKADYWRWHKPGADGAYAWRNAVPLEIVEIFEAHGFIWGGKWHHYDTMHFEYRPELLVRE